MKEIISFLLVLLGFISPSPTPPTPVPVIISPTQVSTPSTADTFLEPIANFRSRITKKSFGIYVTPKNSPISPEKFTGYHTGVDVEYQDISAPVIVKAVISGQIIFAGRVNGYGGVVIQKSKFQDQDITILYGHLKLSSNVKANQTVKAGEEIAVLGDDYSSDTDGERRHLHFAIKKGSTIDFRGYVFHQSLLNSWYNPLDFYK